MTDFWNEEKEEAFNKIDALVRECASEIQNAWWEADCGHIRQSSQHFREIREKFGADTVRMAYDRIARLKREKRRV